MATYASDGSPSSIQSIHDNVATVDGDTITLPSGTFTWNTGVTITKAVTLSGNSTISNAGSSDCSASDATTVVDALNKVGYPGLIKITATGSKRYNVTGISFLPGTRPDVIPPASDIPNGTAFKIQSSLPAVASGVRIHNCHFQNLHVLQNIGLTGWVYGVCDHCFFEFDVGSRLAFLVWHDAFDHYNTGGRIQGNGSFEAEPFFGTNRFWFAETNTFIRQGASASGIVDATFGGRFVIRHNYIGKGIIADHGTEAGARGVRCKEVYSNTWVQTGAGNSQGVGGSRGGSSLVHDNIVTASLSNAGSCYGLSSFRTTGEQSTAPLYGTSDGTSLWDANDTDGAGNYVEGDTPHVFESGTASATSTTGTLTDTTKSWTTNQWAGYSVHNDDAVPPMCYGSVITANTATTISYNPVQTQNNKLIFAAGDDYKVRRVLKIMDGSCYGTTDITTVKSTTLNGNITFPAATIPILSTTGFPSGGGQVLIGPDGSVPPKPPVYCTYTGISGNSLTGCTNFTGIGAYKGTNPGAAPVQMIFRTSDGSQVFPNSALEPAYAWNNLHTNTSTSLGFATGYPGIIHANTEYYALGSGKQIDDGVTLDAPTEVKAKYVAALNGVDYLHAYQYPHELIASLIGKIISLSGTGLIFGNIAVGATGNGTLRIDNVGDATITVTSVSYPAAFTGATSGFSVTAGSTHNISVTFTPVASTSYSGNITVNSDATVPAATQSVSGTGVSAGTGGHGRGHLGRRGSE